MQKILIAVGLFILVLGLFWPWIVKTGIGRLPGDILVKKGSLTFYFPIVTCIVLSLIVSIILWLLNK